jgi:hypothetical protein
MANIHTSRSIEAALGSGDDGGTIIEDLRTRFEMMISQNMVSNDTLERIQIQLASGSDVMLEPGEGSM